MIFPFNDCEGTFSKDKIHNYLDGACLNCGKETPERTPGTVELTKEEIEALWRLLSHHYISYEDVKALEVVRKIAKLHEILAG